MDDENCSFVSKNPERSLEDSRLASRRRVARQPDTPLLCGGTSEGDSLLAHRRADRGDLTLTRTFQKKHRVASKRLPGPAYGVSNYARRQTLLHPRRDEPLPTPVSRGDFCGCCARWVDTNTPFCASPLLSIFDSHSSTSYDIKTRPLSQEGSKDGARAED